MNEDTLFWANRQRINQLLLFTETGEGSCSMGCSYCFLAKSGTNFVMEKATLHRAIDFLREIVVPGREPSLHFFGTEPTKNWDLIVAAREYAPDMPISMTTNGHLLSRKRIEWLNENDVKIYVFSLDGGEEQNAARVDRKGNSTWGIVTRNLKMLLETQQAQWLTVRGTWFPTDYDLLSRFKAVMDLGARSIQFVPVTDAGFDEERVKRAYLELGEHFNWRWTPSKFVNDMVRRVRDEENAPQEGNGCGVGTGYWAVSPDGRLSLCLTPDTVVRGAESKAIDKVQRGELVYTHKGRLRPVKHVMRRHYDGEILRIKTQSLPAINITPEHPLLIWRGRRVDVDNYRDPQYALELQSEALDEGSEMWVEAKDLSAPKTVKGRTVLGTDCLIDTFDTEVRDVDIVRVSDYIDVFVNPRTDQCTILGTQSVLPNTIELTDNFLRLLGWFVAEGSASVARETRRDAHVRWALNQRKEMGVARWIQSVLEEHLGVKSTIEKCGKSQLYVTTYNNVLGTLFALWFGKGSKNKSLPEWVMKLEPSRQRLVLEGLYAGDGCLDGSGQPVLSTISQTLAYQVREILLRNGEICSVKMWQRRTKVHPEFQVRHYTRRITRNTGPFIRGDKVFYPILRIERVRYSGDVYNLEVEEDNSYVANGAIVHNCQLYEERQDIGGLGDIWNGVTNPLPLLAISDRVNTFHTDADPYPKQTDVYDCSRCHAYKHCMGVGWCAGINLMATGDELVPPDGYCAHLRGFAAAARIWATHMNEQMPPDRKNILGFKRPTTNRTMANFPPEFEGVEWAGEI